MNSLVTTVNPNAIDLMGKADRLFEKARINEKGYCALRALATGFLTSAEQLAGISHAGLIRTFDRVSTRLAEQGLVEMVTHVEPVALSSFGFSSGHSSPKVVATDNPEVFMSFDYMNQATFAYSLEDTCREGDFLAQLRTMRGMYVLWLAQEIRNSTAFKGNKYAKELVNTDADTVAYAINDLVESVGL